MSYAAQSDIEAVFGVAEVAAWTFYLQPGGATAPADPTRIAAALAYADAEVDGLFAGGPYAVPLQASAAAAPTVAQWAGVIAGCYLYGSRATVSYVDYAGTRYLALKDGRLRRHAQVPGRGQAARRRVAVAAAEFATGGV